MSPNTRGLTLLPAPWPKSVTTTQTMRRAILSNAGTMSTDGHSLDASFQQEGNARHRSSARLSQGDPPLPNEATDQISRTLINSIGNSCLMASDMRFETLNGANQENAPHTKPREPKCIIDNDGRVHHA